MKRAHTFSRNLHQVRTCDKNLQSLIIIVIRRRHVQSSVQSYLHFSIAVYHLEFILQFLHKLLILDGRVIHLHAAFIAVVLSIINIGNHIHIDRLERFLGQIILRKVEIPPHFTGRRSHTARTQAHWGKEQGGSYRQNTKFLHIHSYFMFLNT